MTLFGLFITPEKWNDVLKSALEAEEQGFDSLWVDDHLLNFREPPEDRLEAWTTITAIAAKTDRIRVGNLVLFDVLLSINQEDSTGSCRFMVSHH